MGPEAARAALGACLAGACGRLLLVAAAAASAAAAVEGLVAAAVGAAGGAAAAAAASAAAASVAQVGLVTCAAAAWGQTVLSHPACHPLCVSALLAAAGG